MPPENTPDITAIQTELAAAHSALESQKVRISELEAASATAPDVQARLTRGNEYLSGLLKAKYEAAPKPIQEKFPIETFSEMDPLDAITQLEGAAGFYTEMERKIREQYNIKDAAIDPTRQNKADKPAFDTSTHRGLLGLASSLLTNNKEKQ